MSLSAWRGERVCKEKKEQFKKRQGEAVRPAKSRQQNNKLGFQAEWARTERGGLGGLYTTLWVTDADLGRLHVALWGSAVYGSPSATTTPNVVYLYICK